MDYDSKDYAIYPLPLCTVEDYPRNHLHWMLPMSSDERVRDCHYIWYIKGPRERYLIDAGIPTERWTAKNLKSLHIQTLDEALSGLGLEVSDINYIIVTHAHHDHITNLRRFPKAKAIIQHDELKEANNPFPYAKPRLPLDYHNLLQGVQWEVVKGDIKIDDNIKLIFTPGHSSGGQSVAVKTSQGLAIVTGFCCQQENFDPPERFKEKGYSFTMTQSHINPIELYESMQRVIDMADIILPSHEYYQLAGVSRIG